MINRRSINWVGLCACALGIAGVAAQQPPQPSQPSFSVRDGDRVVLLGDTVIEREQRYAALEPRLQLALGERSVSVRNLGWSGDTVFGDARAYFGPPEEGIERLRAHLRLLKPTVVAMCYGSRLAFEGLGNLPHILTGYRKLISTVRAEAPRVRVVIMSPPPLENLPSPLPNQAGANRNLKSFRDTLKEFALRQNAHFIDLFGAMGGSCTKELTKHPRTENGVHYTSAGYDAMALAIVKGLGLKPAPVGNVQLAELRARVLAKDELFFNRWRPQNETYLFGFRKHEQGQNAKEIPMFDPLVQKADEAIRTERNAVLDRLKQP